LILKVFVAMPTFVALLCLAPTAMITAPSHRCTHRGRHLTRREAAAAFVGLMAPSSALSAPPAEMGAVDLTLFRRIAGGGQCADIKLGSGPEVTTGSKVSLQWVLRAPRPLLGGSCPGPPVPAPHKIESRQAAQMAIMSMAA